jgi:TatA/E family protein of Tat protein translocase
MMGVDVGAPELLIILVVALLILGPSQLPKLSRSLGQAAREFRHGSETGGAEPDAGDGVTRHSEAPRSEDPPPTAE